jgi:hypothetical protein
MSTPNHAELQQRKYSLGSLGGDSGGIENRQNLLFRKFGIGIGRETASTIV